jgi:hypothetical protein
MLLFGSKVANFSGIIQGALERVWWLARRQAEPRAGASLVNAKP